MAYVRSPAAVIALGATPDECVRGYTSRGYMTHHSFSSRIMVK